LYYVLDIVETAGKRGLLDGGHVVVGADDDRALALSHRAGLGVVINDAPEHGLSHSLRLGLAALEESDADRMEGVLLFLGDQPLVRLDVIEALVERWRSGSGDIVRPRYQARPEVPGHPVLLARSVWQMAHRLRDDQGFSALDSSQFDTVTLDVPGDNPDIDTRADLLGLEEASR
jgi:molybdenum cofactor cytidylyltransferase